MNLSQKSCYYEQGQYVCRTDLAETIATWGLVALFTFVVVAMLVITGVGATRYVRGDH